MRTLSCIKDFRKSIVRLIRESDIPGIGENVYEARMESAWPEESAFAVVYTPNVNFNDNRTSPRFYIAEMEVVVDIYARATTDEHDDETAISDVNAFLDDAAEEIVKALQPVEKREGPFKGMVKRFVLTGFANNLNESGETFRGSERVTFSAEFAVCVTNGGPTDEFLTAKNRLEMGDGNENTQTFDTKMRNSR